MYWEREGDLRCIVFVDAQSSNTLSWNKIENWLRFNQKTRFIHSLYGCNTSYTSPVMTDRRMFIVSPNSFFKHSCRLCFRPSLTWKVENKTVDLLAYLMQAKEPQPTPHSIKRFQSIQCFALAKPYLTKEWLVWLLMASVSTYLNKNQIWSLHNNKIGHG